MFAFEKYVFCCRALFDLISLSSEDYLKVQTRNWYGKEENNQDWCRKEEIKTLNFQVTHSISVRKEPLFLVFVDFGTDLGFILL